MTKEWSDMFGVSFLNQLKTPFNGCHVCGRNQLRSDQNEPITRLKLIPLFGKVLTENTRNYAGFELWLKNEISGFNVQEDKWHPKGNRTAWNALPDHTFAIGFSVSVRELSQRHSRIFYRISSPS